jgi:hypothetical protein
MRTIILIAVILLCCNPLKSQCSWEHKTKKTSEWIEDPFDKTLSRSTMWSPLCGNFSTSISFKIKENIKESDTTFYVYIKYRGLNNTSDCFNDDSQLLIKAGENILRINLLGGIHCGDILVNYGVLKKKDMQMLKEVHIDILRIKYAEGIEDYTIKFDEDKEYFMQTLKCFN